ncbi:MAG: hypothetical protein KKF44_04405 [Nanoarchaeota archaeon]|nr:hypothetical protein [Nanoarchaeota archaeon]
MINEKIENSESQKSRQSMLKRKIQILEWDKSTHHLHFALEKQLENFKKEYKENKIKPDVDGDENGIRI